MSLDKISQEICWDLPKIANGIKAFLVDEAAQFMYSMLHARLLEVKQVIEVTI